ncbi:MAG: aryl-sulfate sulfotransferase [Planctomycetota bacterium]
MSRMLHAVLTGWFACVALSAQAPGLRLFGPTGPNETQLVDGQGQIVHSWPGATSPTVYLLEDGSLLRGTVAPGTGIPGSTGRLEKRAFDGSLTWDYLVTNSSWFMHHDIEPMPNGNVLVIVWDNMVAADAVAAGRDPALLMGNAWYPDALVEIQPTGPTTGTVVWEWHIMDHVIQDQDASKANFGVIANHPELLNINYPQTVLSNGDWNHSNGIDYDPANDWIVLSSREQGEIYLIDHSTTTAEAAGHTGGARGKGGDLLWRWGNPQVYGGGSFLDRRLTGAHDTRFIRPGIAGAGNITVFNNRYLPTQSAVIEIEVPLDAAGDPFVDPATGRFGPVAPLWQYTAAGFFSQFVSSAQRLEDGNTLICSGTQQWLFEVTPQGQIVWQYTWPVNNFIFQAHEIDRRMWNDASELSVAGGQVQLDHLSDTENAGKPYIVFGSITGTTPGALLPGGVLLPLNIDALTTITATSYNTPLLVNTFGTFDALGNAASSIVLPGGLLPPELAGLQLSFAHVVLDGTGLALDASNVCTVTLTQ